MLAVLLVLNQLQLSLLFPDSEYSEHPADPDTEAGKNRYQRMGLSVSEREEIGRAAKGLLNEGRCRYLREEGLSAKLVYYVSRGHTLENVALIASRTQ